MDRSVQAVLRKNRDQFLHAHIATEPRVAVVFVPAKNAVATFVPLAAP